MRRTVALFAIAAALVIPLFAGGCSLFGGKDDKAAAKQQAAIEARYEPVIEVREIEIGRTRNGLVITAYGTAPGLGYGTPELRPRRDGKPAPDGYLDFDFVVRAPVEPPAATAEPSSRARQVRADRPLALKELRGARGLRIHAAEGGMLMNF